MMRLVKDSKFAHIFIKLQVGDNIYHSNGITHNYTINIYIMFEKKQWKWHQAGEQEDEESSKGK